MTFSLNGWLTKPIRYWLLHSLSFKARQDIQPFHVHFCDLRRQGTVKFGLILTVNYINNRSGLFSLLLGKWGTSYNVSQDSWIYHGIHTPQIRKFHLSFNGQIYNSPLFQTVWLQTYEPRVSTKYAKLKLPIVALAWTLWLHTCTFENKNWFEWKWVFFSFHSTWEY